MAKLQTVPVTPSNEALTLFFRSLATMFSAGVPPDRALLLLATQSEDSRMGAAAGAIEKRVHSGFSLSAAFEAQGCAFSRIQLGLLKVGERTGTLDKVLARLADYEEKRRDIAMKVKSALTYPAFLMISTTFMLVVIPPFLFQGLFAMLEGSGVELPLISRVVVAVSSFIRSPLFWVLCIVMVAVGVVLWPRLTQCRQFQIKFAELLLTVPVAGNFYRVLVTTRFSRAMQLQLQVGEAPLQGMKLAALAADCPVLEQSIGNSVICLKGGSTLVESLAAADYFPKAFLAMLRAGEESAELSDIMGRTTAMYEGELEYAIEAFTSLLEPIIMFVMGVIVGIVVVATMLPMMKMIQNV